MRLYRVTIRASMSSYRVSYAVAESADAAYALVRAHMDENNLCFLKEREMERVELIAEDDEYPDCECHLFLTKGRSHE